MIETTESDKQKLIGKMSVRQGLFSASRVLLRNSCKHSSPESLLEFETEMKVVSSHAGFEPIKGCWGLVTKPCSGVVPHSAWDTFSGPGAADRIWWLSHGLLNKTKQEETRITLGWET